MMFIDLEDLSRNGNSINFTNNNKSAPDFTNYGLQRPDYLPLSKRQSFFPTLPATPECIPHERSYSSLPRAVNRLIDDDVFTKPPIYEQRSCVIRSRNCIDAKPRTACDVNERKDCCPWLLARWLKFLGKSPPKRDIAVHCEIRKRHNGVTRSPVISPFRRRAATVQPVSLFGKENQRTWGEESLDDVIYRVMLRRIIRTGTPSEPIIDGLQWETQKVKQIKYATLDRLVEQLCLCCGDDVTDPNFLTVFLATYRSFATPDTLLDQIAEQFDRINGESPAKRLSAIRSVEKVLRSWIEKYFNEDFYSPPHHSLIKRAIRIAETNKNYDVTKTSSDSDLDDFVDYLQSKLKAAEVKGMQEHMIQKLNSPSHSDVKKIEDCSSSEEDTSFNLTSSTTFLNDLTTSQVARQLTLKASVLFSRVVPHHCLQAVRSSKEKPACVKANIEQFNTVVYCVWGTCLCPSLKTQQRAKIVQKWIEVAQECYELKNLSSLRAIISTLLTHQIHRLTKTWAAVPKNTIELLGELKELNTKETVLKIGVAKINTDSSSFSKALSRKSNQTKTMHGTVPYLGSFLTDLTYLHTALPDKHQSGLINFDKRRKEFDFLAQFQLWQASARCYQSIESDQKFFNWFNSITLPTSEKALNLSEEIEPPPPIPMSPCTPITPIRRTISDIFHHNSNGGLESSGSSSTSLHFNHTRNTSNEGSECSSTRSDKSKLDSHGNDCKSDEGRFINVRVIRKEQTNDNRETKVMELSQNDRVQAVIKQVLQLFEIVDEDIQNFSLVQIVSAEKELVMPECSNVFYAMVASLNLSKQYHFALLENGAEIPKEKHLGPPSGKTQKEKKHHKKSKSLSSSTNNVSSPMRSIFSNIALGSLTMASGSYSVAKHEDGMELGSRDSTASSEKTMSLDSVSISTSNDLSDFEHEEESGRYNRMKSLRKSQSQTKFEIESRQRSHPISGRSPSAIQRMSKQSSYASSEQSSEDEIEPFSRSMDGKIKQRNPVRRSHNVSTGSEFFQRKKAIRKHHSHPKRSKSSYRKMSEEEVKAEATKQRLSIQRQDSRSTFYVEIGSSERSSAPSLHKLYLESAIPENGEAKRHAYSSNRTVSEPDLIDRETSGNESVFSGEASPSRPRIILQCPSLSITGSSPVKSPSATSSHDGHLFVGTENVSAEDSTDNTSDDRDEITRL